jgi:Tol biopolymer transport system component
LVRIVNGSNEIVQVRLADAAARPLSSTAGVEETWPLWSETAKRVVVEISKDGVAHDLALIDPEGGTTTTLTDTPHRDEQWPSWSPKRPELAFAFLGGAPLSGITLFDVSQGSGRVLAQGGARDFFFRPSFAPDGARLVAQRRRKDGLGSGLWLLDEAGGARALTDDPAWIDTKPFFTRGGSEIVFSRAPAGGGPRDVVAIPAAGGAVRTIASTPQSDEHSARPSPRRDEIVFVSNRSGRWSLYLAPLAGGAARALGPDGEHHAFAPQWSPDGERIVATVTPISVGTPRLAEQAGLAQTRVVVLERSGRVLLDTPGFMPDWMPPWRDP